MRVLRLKSLAGDEGGVTFIEVLATVVMLVAAAVSTTYSLFVGERLLEIDRHRVQVARVLQQEVEYWVGRVYTGNPAGGDPTTQEMLGSTGVPYKTVTIDSTSQAPVQVKLYYDPIIQRGDPNTPNSAYWVITVRAKWKERGATDNGAVNPNQRIDFEDFLTTYVSWMGTPE